MSYTRAVTRVGGACSRSVAIGRAVSAFRARPLAVFIWCSLVVHRADIFHRTLRARPLMAPDVDLRSTAIALRLGLIQPIGIGPVPESVLELFQTVLSLRNTYLGGALPLARPPCTR